MESVFGYKQKISFVSTFCLGRRLYVIDHATISVDHEIIYPLQTGQRLRSKSMGVGWGKFYEHGAEARPCGKRGKRPSFVFCQLVCRISARVKR